MVTLVGGETVWSDAEAWRLECEARYVLKLEDWHQAQYLLVAVDKRGPGASERLQAKIDELRAAA